MRPRPWLQGTLFEAEPAIMRTPGWHLIANSAGVQGFHVVDHTNPDRGVTTVCGVVGRVVDNGAAVIVPCSTCAAAEPS